MVTLGMIRRKERAAMGFMYRVRRSSDSFGGQARVIVRRVAFWALVALVIGRWATGEWILWLAAVPAAFGLWQLSRALRHGVLYVRGRRWGPGPIAPRWWRADE